MPPFTHCQAGDGCDCAFPASPASTKVVDLDEAERDAVRTSAGSIDCNNLPPGCCGVYHVHGHPRGNAHAPRLHTVLVGRDAGVHMCTCLQLAHKGLPCRHYFAVLLRYPALHFSAAAAHPRWLRGPALTRVRFPARTTQRPVAQPAAAAAAAVAYNAQEVAVMQSAEFAQLNRQTADMLRGMATAAGANVTGVKRKADVVLALLRHKQPQLFTIAGGGSGDAAAAAPAGGGGSDTAATAPAAATAAAPAVPASRAGDGNGGDSTGGEDEGGGTAAPAATAGGDGSDAGGSAAPTDASPFERSLAFLVAFDINNSSAAAAVHGAVQVRPERL
jgi:hypothetical protein